MKIITLVENVSDGVLGCAHGLSLYAQTGRHRILFDASPTGEMLLKNAEALGVDLSKVDISALSHAHYDHSGGLMAFMEANKSARLYIHERAFKGHFAMERDGWRNIGIDPALGERFSERIVRTGDMCVIDDELTLFSDIKTCDFVSGSNSSLYEETEEGNKNDTFRHEQDMLIRTGGKTVLIAGCAHRGIINILRRAEEIIGRPADYVFAGFHLTNPGLKTDEPEEFVRSVGEELKKRDTIYYTGHCTGLGPYGILKGIMGEKLRYMSVGTVVEI